MPQSRPLFDMSFPPTVARLQELVMFPALTVMVFIRRNLGYGLLNPIRIMVMSALLILFAGHLKPASGPELLRCFAVILLLAGLWERWRRWREFCSGVGPHSHYIGDSCFEFRWLPMFIRRNRRIPRFLDPIVCIIAGALAHRVAPALGIWIAFSGLCLRFFEDGVYMKHLNRELDIRDGLIQSVYQAETAQWQSKRLPGHPAAPPQEGIPAGYAADIQKTILRRTRRQRRHRD